MNGFLNLWLAGHILAAPTGAGITQVTSLLTTIESDLVTILLVLGPVVFLIGLVAHGLSSSHNSQNGLAWGSRAMRAGAGIFIGALVVDLLFSLLTSLFG